MLGVMCPVTILKNYITHRAQATTTGQFEKGKREEEEKELGGSTSCRMKAGLTFAGRNEETKVNIKRLHLIFLVECQVMRRVLLKDESRGGR